jgi:hypothetical protein
VVGFDEVHDEIDDVRYPPNEMFDDDYDIIEVMRILLDDDEVC